MSRFASCFIALTVLVSMASLIEGIGFPSGGGGGCGCGGGGGGGCGGGCGGCGRKKRDTAIQPHYKADETPCPQSAWREILEENISEDALGSVGAIQTGLYRRYNDQKFLVTCAAANEAKEAAAAANKVHFSSSGDGYCNLVKNNIWCQAVALSA